ncbi:hypothetical protein ACH5RR_024023 [Cinchona calisaya]|uniref:Uncharacterized protein n=1 Tax=Cinchona calisaya TaxID=153742 RepID=A0ABD2ZE58_9GENT
MVLLAAIRLDVFEIIAKAGPGAQLSPSEIATQLSLKNPDAATMLDRMLRLLACYSVITCSVAAAASEDGVVESQRRVYGLAPVAKYFVRNAKDGESSLGSALALIHDKVFLDCWYELEDAVREGGVPFERVHGTNAYEYTGRDPRFNEVLNKAMLLKNCHRALSDNGRVLAVDYILPLIPDTSACGKTVCQTDMIMMTHNPGGKERSEQEILALATAAGFRGMRIDCFVCNLWVMEFYK